MKGRTVFLLILILVVIDQVIKIYVKTNFYYGEEVKVFNWFRIQFIENEGMAWGLKLGNGDIGKLVLTVLRLAAVVWGTFYIGKLIRQNFHRGYILCTAFIYAGALGNLLDSLFYGVLFEKSDPLTGNIARAFASEGGYAGLFVGHVVDMWYFPIFSTTLPDWVPVWGGKYVHFFSYVFNTADVWVSAGVIALLIFHKRFLANSRANVTNDSYNR